MNNNLTEKPKLAKKKLLAVYPHNFFQEKSGINSRFLELMEYFKSRGFHTDMLTLQNFSSSWENFPPDKKGLIRELYFYDYKKGARWQLPRNKKSSAWGWLKKRVSFLNTYSHLPDFAFPGMKRMLERLVRQNGYDYILISYVYWADLIRSESFTGAAVTTILDLSDFVTLNRFDSAEGSIKIGPLIEEEIRRVNLFDKVLCISEDEMAFFSQFASRPAYSYIPFFTNRKEPPPGGGRHFDILFVGSDNPHNRKGIAWFLDEIGPALDAPVKILIVGSVSNFIKPSGNITCIPYADNLEEIYSDSKISVCPLNGGTGMKIKVVEALSYGLPVVTTWKGMAGFPSHTDTGCLIGETPSEFTGHIRRLLSDPGFYRRQSGLAARFFLDNFEKSHIYSSLDRVFEQQTERP